MISNFKFQISDAEVSLARGDAEVSLARGDAEVSLARGDAEVTLARGDAEMSLSCGDAEMSRLRGATALRAVGEIGLDYYYSPETRDAQLALFSRQLEEARAKDLPVVIHTREADEDTVALLKEIPSRGIIHCYTGTPDFAKRYLDLGFYISISGIVTFRAADNVRASALVVPDDRILIETDSPFLAPVPMRGKPNEPAFIRHTCEFLAKLRGTAAEEFAERTFTNAERVLG